MGNTKGLFIITIIVSLALLGVTSNQGGAQTSVATAQTSLGRIKPEAGTWKTWVLASGSQLRLPPPPDSAASRAEIDELQALASQRDAAARDRITFWNAGAPSYRWVEVALERILKGPVRGLNASRHVALVNVAMYDATIAAWDSKYAHNRP